MNGRAPSFTRNALAVYAVGAVASAILIGVFLREPGIVWPGPTDALIGVGIGVVAVIPVEIFSVWLFRYRPRTRELGDELRAIMGPIGTVGIAALALASGVAEEIAFRGLVQSITVYWTGPVLGILGASIVFGLMHIPPRRTLAGWMVFAGCIGLYLGVIFHWTGNIIAPAVTHALVNLINLHVIANIQPIAGWFYGERVHA